jgi:hypothetical protein
LKHRKLEASETEQIQKELTVYGFSVIPQLLRRDTVCDMKARVESLWDQSTGPEGVPGGAMRLRGMPFSMRSMGNSGRRRRITTNGTGD